MPQTFSTCRITSVTRPNFQVGLSEIYANLSCPFTAETLSKLTAADLSFYLNGSMFELRGKERFTEKFVLQGGNQDQNWVDIKAIVPDQGEEPETDDDDESHEAMVDWYANNPDHPAAQRNNPDYYPEDIGVM